MLLVALIIILLLLFIIAVFYYFEIHPYLSQKWIRKYRMLPSNTPVNEFKAKVFHSAKGFSKHEVPKMSLADNTYFPIVFIQRISIWIKGSNRLKNSFPRAFLLNGMYDYAQDTHDDKTIFEIESKISKFIGDVSQFKNQIHYTDQVSMGMVILKLYKKTNKEIYKKACDELIDYLINSVDKKHGIILYRKNQDFHYVDILGMICPFILMYAEIFNRHDLIELSNHQIRFYIKNGLTTSHLPYHGLDLVNLAPIGSSNWGRGLGWYSLALSATIAYTNPETNPDYNFFQKEIDALEASLQLYKQDHYWGQFLGISKKWHTDTSASTMIFYSLTLAGYKYNYKDFYKFIKPLTRKDGTADFTSGDTEDINIYSREYGISELTQGLLLSIFKNEKSNENNINPEF